MSPARICGLLLVFGVACGDDAGYDDTWAAANGQPGTPAVLTVVSSEPEGAACPSGGERIQVGIDSNADAQLEPAEVSTTTIVCNDARPESPVASCPTRQTRGLPPLEAFWHRSLELVGAGFIPLKGSAGEPRANYYARKVMLHLDKEGCLSTGDELRVQGFRKTSDGTMNTAELSDLCVAPLSLSAMATSRALISVNLNEGSTVPAQPFDVLSPATSSNFSTASVVYDSLGKGHQLTVYFAKLGTGLWGWHAVAAGNELTGGTDGVPFEGASGVLEFNTDGALRSDRQESSSWDFADASPGQRIEFDFGTSLEAEHGTGLDGTTNFANDSTTYASEQDGYPAGSLTDFQISDVGVLSAGFTNGVHKSIALIPIASFAAADGLAGACNDLWVQTEASGEPTFGNSGTLGRGSFLPIVD
jgi:flagellar hook protein FlgE